MATAARRVWRVSVHELVSSYGYAAVFVLVMVESFGVPLPGETVLVAAASYAGATHRLSVWLVFVIGAAAAILGDTIGYWIGDVGGYRLLLRYGHFIRIDEPKVKVARYLFEHHGGPVVFFGRFVSVLRTYAAFLAGTTRMRYRRFLVSNVSGGVLWAALYCFLAYKAASFLSQVSTPFAVVGGAVAVVAVVVVFLVVRNRIGALTARAEAAYPGPLDADDRSRHAGPGRTDGGPVA